MRNVSMATRAELIEAIGKRYRSADRESKGRVRGGDGISPQARDAIVANRWAGHAIGRAP